MAEAATDFYYMTGCPWCVSAHVALQEAGVQYNSHTLDLRAGANHMTHSPRWWSVCKRTISKHTYSIQHQLISCSNIN
jgi:hypothetical protein